VDDGKVMDDGSAHSYGDTGQSSSLVHTQHVGINVSLGSGATFFDGVLFALLLAILTALFWKIPLAKLREPVTLFTAVLAFATAVLAFVSVLQWRTLDQQARIMDRTDETFRAGERAFVFPAPNNVGFLPATKTADGKINRWYPSVWENSGNSPTVNLVINTYCLKPLIFAEANPIKVLPNPSANVQRLLGPKQKTQGGECSYTDAQLSQVRDSGYHLYTATSADYFDIFGKHHYTETCFELGGFSKDAKFEDATVNPTFDIKNCGRNCADKECK
jgi:hypothetical protein